MNRILYAFLTVGALSSSLELSTSNSTNLYQYSVSTNNIESSVSNLVYAYEFDLELYNNIKKLLLNMDLESFDENFNELIINNNFEFVFEKVMSDFDEEKRISILSDFLETNINIFTKWYVIELKKSLYSNKQDIKLKAQSFYELYKDSFDKVYVN